MREGLIRLCTRCKNEKLRRRVAVGRDIRRIRYVYQHFCPCREVKDQFKLLDKIRRDYAHR